MISADGDIVHASAHTGKYLELPAGPPSNNIFDMARRGLRLDLRAAVYQAFENGQATVQSNVPVGTNGDDRIVNLIVQPIGDDKGEGMLYVIVFQDAGGNRPLPEAEAVTTVDDAQSATLHQLEADLRATRDRLQATTEELESSNEELKSGNEELQSINEELQSANEELETSKEELQSINEELQTVNAELKARVDELSHANSDIANLLESTQIATVFLDRELTVKSFTPAAKDVFHLVESDVGRPISHVRARVRFEALLDDAERVTRTLATAEEQVETEDGTRRYIMRILPYRTVENVIAGVVLNFIDVTRITAAEREIVRLTRDLRDRVEFVERILDLVPVGIFIVGTDPRQHVQVNRYGARLLDEDDAGPGPRDVAVPYRLFQGDQELAFWEQPLQRAAFSGQAVSAIEGRLARHDGSFVDVMVQAEPLLDEQGAPRGAIAAMVYVSERKKAESTQSRLVHELQHRVKNILATVAALAKRMLASGASLDEFAAAFETRLLAMGRLHQILSEGPREGADLSSLASAVLAPYANSGNDNVELSGAAVALQPNEAVTLGLVLTELASNAAKYGALSVPAGRAELAWTVRDDAGTKWLSLDWKERNGPRIETFPSMGFGTRFITQSIDYELEGVAKLTFRPEGLRCEIDFPLRDSR